jgi:hypothetical protein
VPLKNPPGKCQIDFGEFCYLDESNSKKKAHELVVSFPHSNAGFIQVFKSQNSECLLEGLKRIFSHIGAVPTTVRADNATTMVTEVKKDGERKLTETFQRFSLHYDFELEFCNPAKGNEKGNVENKVGYKRRNLLVPTPQILDFESFNVDLLKRCDKDNERLHYIHEKPIVELFFEDKRVMKPLPKIDFPAVKYEVKSVDKFGFIQVDTNKYLAGMDLQGQLVGVEIWYDKIVIFCDNNPIKRHSRCYETKKTISDWRDYLPVLIRKPRATTNTKFFDQMPLLWQKHLESLKGKELKDSLILLNDIIKDGNENISNDVLEIAEESGKTDIETLKACYLFVSNPEHHPLPLTLKNDIKLNNNPSLDAYNTLCQAKNLEV